MSPSRPIRPADPASSSLEADRVVGALKAVLIRGTDPDAALQLAGEGRVVARLTEAVRHEVMRRLDADRRPAAADRDDPGRALEPVLRRLVADLLPAMMATWTTPERGTERFLGLVDAYLDAGGRADLEAALAAARAPDATAAAAWAAPPPDRASGPGGCRG